MLWPLFVLPIVSSTVFPYPLKDFRRDCQNRDNNGVCDLDCRNFFPGAEQSDCREEHLATHNATLLFEVHDISFRSIVFKEKNRSYYCEEWRKGLEWRLRKYMQVEVELLLSDKEIFDMGVECFESGGICFVDLTFAITLADCASCPTLDDALGKLSQHQEVLSEMALRYIPPEKKSSSSTELVFIVIGTVGLLAFVVVNVLVTTTRRRKIHSYPIWIPPMEKKEDRFMFSNQLPCYYDHFVDSGRTSLNNSLNGSFSLTQSPHVVDSKITDLHLLSQMNLPEEEMIKRADHLIQQWGADINAVTDKGETAVNLAVRRSKCLLADHLLQRGANGNIPDSSGYSLLHHAVSLEDVSMLKMLLGHQKLTTEECDEKEIKPIDQLSGSGKTALMECAFIRGGRGVEMARMLIAAGADIMVQGEKDYCLNNADYSGKAVLHYAAQCGNIPLIQLLVNSTHENALLLNLLDYHNKTAMYYACEQRHYSTVELLMELGASQYCPATEPSSFPIEAAKERGYDDIIKLLETYKSRARTVPPKPNKYAVRKSKQRAAEQAQLPSPSSSTSSSPSSCSQSPPTTSPVAPSTVFDYRSHQNISYYHPYASFDSQCRYNSKLTRLSPPYFSPPMTDESTTP